MCDSRMCDSHMCDNHWCDSRILPTGILVQHDSGLATSYNIGSIWLWEHISISVCQV